MKRRVVITGVGSVSSIGVGAYKLWKSIKEGKCGISTIERIDISNLPVKVGAEVKDFNPEEFIDKKEVRRTDRFAQFALAAAKI